MASIGNPPIRIALADGTTVSLARSPSLGTVRIKEWGAFLKLLIDPELYFGDAYSEGSVEIDGDLREILIAVYAAIPKVARARLYPEIVSRWLERHQVNSIDGSRHNISKHYDIGTDFYRLWLDSRLVYTCAYFPSHAYDLERAQLAKLDYICRKVAVQPGEVVVEAGCGWGALAMHMAARYGARVRAFNISHEQITYARERARSAGLDGMVEFIEDDYRNISGRFDIFVSVGMLEHVGLDHYPDFGKVIQRSLSESGRGFLHFIGRNRKRRLNSWIRKRIFPGAYPPTMRQVMEVLERGDFSVLDVENLRMHYARTLELWLEKFEKSADRIAGMFSPEFARAWRLYLAGSAAAFRVGSLQLFQVTFARANNNRIRWTRDHLYDDEVAEFASQ